VSILSSDSGRDIDEVKGAGGVVKAGASRVMRLHRVPVPYFPTACLPIQLHVSIGEFNEVLILPSLERSSAILTV